MERSLTARGAIGRLALPLGLRAGARPRRARGPSTRARPRGLAQTRWATAALGLLAPLWGRRRARIALLATLLAFPLMGGGFLLLRHSSLVAVRHVQVTGVSGPESRAIEAALGRAARHLSTLDVQSGALRAAVAQFAVVRELTAVAHFPHGLAIHVSEQLPVAALVVGGVRTAVAADGVVLGPALLSPSLPAVGGWSAPPPGARLHDHDLLGAMAVLGAAPHRLAARVARVYVGPQGLTVRMRNGLVVYFGDDSRAHAKWLALAAVLADHSSAGAIYIDVRLPARPAAGFPAGAGPPLPSTGSESSAAEATSPQESAVGALAEKLSPPAAAGTGASGAGEPEGPPSAPSGGAGSESRSSGESASPRSAETGGAGETSAPASSQGAAEAPAVGG
jgi:cell division protein FtsQ